MDSDQIVVCLSPTTQQAFSNTPIKINLGQNFAIDAQLSATTKSISLSIPIPDSTTTPILNVNYNWTQILMHSISEDGSIMMIIECFNNNKPNQKNTTLEDKLCNISPILSQALLAQQQQHESKSNQQQGISDSTKTGHIQQDSSWFSTNSNDNEDDDNIYDDGDDEEEEEGDVIMCEINFTVVSPPQSHIPILSIDFIPIIADDEDDQDSVDKVSQQMNETENDELAAQNSDDQTHGMINTDASSNTTAVSTMTPSALIYQLFNQCVSLNPDTINNNNGSYHENMFDTITGGDDEDLMMFEGFEGMFTAEFFEAEEKEKEKEKQRQLDHVLSDNCNNDDYIPGDEDRYVHRGLKQD